jgi:glycosyltransferase involved in cell wall biosynthesis
MAPDPVQFTVAIPTYNGARRLPLVLDALGRQRVPPEVVWEIILVDNNSTDQTAAVVAQYQRSPAIAVPLQYVLEPCQGAAYGRRRAVAIARGEWVGFLDDDNVPDDDWVAAAAAFIRDRGGAIGAISSQIRGWYEVPPPPGFERIKAFLAIQERGDAPRRYDPAHRLLPPSAGLVVRRQAWLDSVPHDLILGGRTATSMLTSEDLETLIYLQRRGWEVWYGPTLKIEHRIPASRLTREYLIPFFRGIGLTKYVIRMLRVPRSRRWLWVLVYGLSDLRRLFIHSWRYRRSLGRDVVADGEWMLYWSSLISPWVMGRHLRKQGRILHDLSGSMEGSSVKDSDLGALNLDVGDAKNLDLEDLNSGSNLNDSTFYNSRDRGGPESHG